MLLPRFTVYCPFKGPQLIFFPGKMLHRSFNQKDLKSFNRQGLRFIFFFKGPKINEAAIFSTHRKELEILWPTKFTAQRPFKGL